MANNLQKGSSIKISTVYNYLVLFATLMMIIGGGVGVFTSLADIIFPEPHYQTFEDYKNYRKFSVADFKTTEGFDFPVISNEELKADYNEMIEGNNDRQVIVAKNRLLKSFAWLLIPLPVFVYFQRRTSKKKIVAKK